jgi:hypothetical protein
MQVLARVFSRTDVDEVLPKNTKGRLRRDRFLEVTSPLLSGVELEIKQQYNWADFEETQKPRGIPVNIQIGQRLH